MSEVNVMKEIFFWVYVASAVLAFLYLFVFARLAVSYFAKQCKAEGLVKIKTPKNWAKFCISLVQCALMIGLPVLNTFFVIVWLCNTDTCMEKWEEMTRECYRDSYHVL